MVGGVWGYTTAFDEGVALQKSMWDGRYCRAYNTAPGNESTLCYFLLGSKAFWKEIISQQV